MIFEEDFEELTIEIFNCLACSKPGLAVDCINPIMKIIKARCEKNYAEYDIKVTEKAAK